MPAAGAGDPAGPNGPAHDATSPDHTYVAPPGRTHGEVIGNFEHRVITQQPLRVVGGVLGDATRLFELHRVTSTGDTPISRWQFQTSYPAYGDSIYLSPDHTIMLGLHFASSGGPVQVRALPAGMGGRATVDRPLASFLRGYQLHGGYTPGPLLALATLAGLAGAVIALARRPGPGSRARLPGPPAAPARPGLPADLRLGRGRAARLRPFRVLLAVPAARPGHAPAWRPRSAWRCWGSLLRRRAAPAISRVRNGTVPGSSPAPAAGGTAGSRFRRAG